MPRHPTTLAEFAAAFWARTDQTTGPLPHPEAVADGCPPTRCWPWTGRTGTGGYGRPKLRGHDHQAHRIAWVLAGGRLTPDQPWVLHRCDNRLCCNPEHLYTGTALDNNRDKERRGRANHARGVRHGSRTKPLEFVTCHGELRPNAVLTEDMVRRIIELRGEGHGREVIAAELGVSQWAIRDVLQGKTWKHITGGPI